jgi:hypothetical protein
MKRILTVLAVALVMVAMFVAMAAPAFADSQKIMFNNHQGQGGKNNTSTNNGCMIGGNIDSGSFSDNQNNGACSLSTV